MDVTVLARRAVLAAPTAHAPGGRPIRPPAALQTTTDERRQQAKQYWPIRRVSNKVYV